MDYVFSACIFFFSFMLKYAHGQTTIFPVTKFGAIPFKNIDNSMAFVSAWKAACQTPGGTLYVPKGTFVVGGANFEGPCNGLTYFQNEGTIRATPGGHNQDFWFQFYSIVGLRVVGNGIFDGYGESAWKLSNRPMSMRFSKVNQLIIQSITSLNSKSFHFHIVFCNGVLVDNVKIFAPGNSPNTDGIHVARSTGVKIINTKISTGDDCVSIGDGSEDIYVDSVMCGPGHGISIGSLGKYQDERDVKGITIINCNLTNTQNGLRIKTFAPSSVSSVVHNITFENINVVNVDNPIILDQHYCPNGRCAHGGESGIKIDGVKFINVKGTSAIPVSMNLECSKRQPCRNLLFDGINIETTGGKPTTAVCSSADYKFVSGNQVPPTCKGAAPSAEEDYMDMELY